MEIYTKQLIQCGLTEHQATLYELLIKKGALRASTITRLLEGRLSRPMVYAVLNELSELGLVEKNDVDTKVARFSPAHPSKLQEVGRVRRAEIDASIEAAATLIPRIVSEYNLVSSKPGVQFYEGIEGLKKVIADTLTAENEILAFLDIDTVHMSYKSINESYRTKRTESKVKKKILTYDTEFVRQRYKNATDRFTAVAVLPQTDNLPKVSMQIYDNKITYLTLIPGSEIGVIIEDPALSTMHKYLFNLLYDNAEKIYVPLDL